MERFRGPGAQQVRTAVVQVLEAEASVDLLPWRRLRDERDLGDETTLEAARLELTAVIRGQATRRARKTRVVLTVVGADGEIVGELVFEGRRPKDVVAAIRAELWDGLAPLLDAAARAAETPDEVAPEAPEPTAPSAPAPKAEPSEAQRHAPTPHCPIVAFGLGGGVLRRTFDYERERQGALRGYHLDRSPTIGVNATVFPLATRGCGLPARLGLDLGYDRVVGAQSSLAGQNLDTAGSAFFVDAVLPLRLPPLTLTPRLGYHRRVFRLGGDFVPDADHQAARVGLAIGVEARPVFAELGGALRFVLDAGELQAPRYYPNAQGWGYAVDLRLGVALTDFLRLVASAWLEQTQFTLNATGPGPYPNGIADGAYDRYLGASLALRAELPRPPR